MRLSDLLKRRGRAAAAPMAVEEAADLRAELLTQPQRTMQDICAMLDHNRGEAAGPEDIYFLFRLLLGRPINPEEASGHMAQIGQDLPMVVRQYLRSREFDLRDMLAPVEGGVALVERGGYALYVDPQDQAVGRHVAAGHYEPHVEAYFRRTLNAGDHVVDIGANIGHFALLAAHLVGPVGRVVAVEPNAGNCRLMEASRQHNHFRHLTILAVAASDRNDVLTLNSAYSNGMVAAASSSLTTLMRSTIVPCARLDHLVHLDRLDLVKIDVEGHETTAMKGFARVIGHHRPIVVSEFAGSGITGGPLPYLDFFLERDYRLAVLEYSGDLTPCADKAAVMDAWRRTGLDHIDIVALPD